MSTLTSDLRHTLGNNPLTLGALACFGLLALGALIGPALVPFDPLMADSSRVLEPPSGEHWFGTDHVGRDILSRVVSAARLDLAIAVGAVLMSLVAGVTLGCLAGYFGGLVDRVISRVVDTVMAFPLFVLAMGVVAAIGNSVENIVYATAIINVPFYVRLARAEVAQRRGAEFVDAAILSGNTSAQVIYAHLLPNILPPLVVQVSLNLGWAVLNAAALSFIGLGVRPPDPEWGIMVAEGASYMVAGQWWVSFFPGAALLAAVLCFNFMGDGLRDIVDARRRT
jgi:peptide/nickel transport system permease protein